MPLGAYHVETSVEEWRAIPGWEGLYEVSDYGRIRTVGRIITRRNGHKQTVRPRLRKLQLNHADYRVVGLKREGESIIYVVSRLVMEAFVGPCPDGMECCHNDGNLANNHVSNLRWDTHQSNVADRKIHNTEPRGSQRPNAKLTESDVPFIREQVAIGVSMRSLGDALGVNPETVRQVIVGRCWRHVT